MSALRSCGICCLGFSLFAIAFLVIVSAVIKSGSDSINIDADKRDKASSNCLIGAAIYAGFVGLSLVCIFVPACLAKKPHSEMQPLKENQEEHY